MGFGINTNILETNVINLATVVSFLGFFGKDLLFENLRERRTKVISNLETLELLRIDVAKELTGAYLELIEATIDSSLVMSTTSYYITMSTNQVKRETNDKLRRLRLTQNATLSVAAQQVISDVQSVLIQKLGQRSLKTFELRLYLMFIELKTDFVTLGYPFRYVTRSLLPDWNKFYAWRVLDENPWLACYRVPLAAYTSNKGKLAKARLSSLVKGIREDRETHLVHTWMRARKTSNTTNSNANA